MAFQQQAGGLQDVLIVVDDQNAGVCWGHQGQCSETDRCPLKCTHGGHGSVNAVS